MIWGCVASGAAHTQATIAAAAVGVAHFGLDNPVAAVGWGVGGLWCIVVQPDLDQLENGGYYGLYVLRSTLPTLEKIWRIYWHPYALLFKHRSFWTHAPLVGTALRLVYAGWFWIPFVWRIDGFYWFLLAVLAFDTLHFIMDFRLWTVLGLFRQKG